MPFLNLKIDPKFWVWPVSLSTREHSTQETAHTKLTVAKRAIKILKALPPGSVVDVKTLCSYMRLDGYSSVYRSSGKRTPEQMMYLTVYGSLSRAVKEGKLVKIGSRFGLPI